MLRMMSLGAKKGSVAGLCVGVALCVTTPTHAQTESVPLELEEVIVTAEKMSRSLQNTSTSVLVLSAEDLLNRPGLDNTTDLLASVANVTSLGTTGDLPAIRGVDGTGPSTGASAFLGGTRSRFAFQLDGRPLSFNETVYASAGFWDVAQVAVLRGPQSTLQGRNAIAGTMAIATKDPTFDWQSGLRLAAGDFSQRQGSMYVSGPLVDEQLAFRLAYDYSELQNFVRPTLLYPGVSDPQHTAMSNARAKLLFQPAALPGFKSVLSINHTTFEGPQYSGVSYPFEDRVSSYGHAPRFEPKATSATLNSSWIIGEQWTFESTLAYTDIDVRRYTFPDDGAASIQGYEAMVEPRFRYQSADGRLSALFGVYYFRAGQDDYLDFLGGMAFTDSTNDTAAFAQLDYKLTERFEVTVGGRYEREHRERFGGNFFLVDLDETYTTFLPKLGLAWHVSDVTTYGVVVSKSYNGGGAAFTFEPPFVNYDYDPEYVRTYEAYWRAKLLDNRLQLTANAFLSDYEDYQLDFDINPDPALYSFVIRNADKVRTYGLELGARWLLAPGLTFSADIGLLNTDIAKYTDNSIEGNELSRSPPVSGGLALSYVSSAGFDAAIDAHYSGRYYSDNINRADERVPPFWLTNAQVGYTFGKVRIFGVVQNLLDEDSYTVIGRNMTADPTDDGAVIPHPRTYRVGVTMDF